MYLNLCTKQKYLIFGTRNRNSNSNKFKLNTMETITITIDIENNSVSFSNEEFSNTLQEAGLSHTDLNDKEEITEYFEERYEEEYDEVIVKFA